MNRMVKLSKRFLANTSSPVSAVEFVTPVHVDSSDVSLNETTERVPTAENGAKPSVRRLHQQQRVQCNPPASSTMPPLLAGPVSPPQNPSGSCGGVQPQQQQDSSGPAPASAFERQFLRTLDKVYQTIEKNEFRLAELDRREEAKHDWQQVAVVVDRLLLLIFIVATLGITAAILFHAPHSSEFLFGVFFTPPGGPSAAAGVGNASSSSSSSSGVAPTGSPPVAASK